MTEVEYGGAGHRTRLRNDHEDQLVCVEVPPAPVYKGSKGEGAAGQEEGAGGVLLLPGVGLPPPILVGIGFPEGERQGEKEKERGAPPPLLLVQFGLGLGGRAACPGQPLSLSRMAQ